MKPTRLLWLWPLLFPTVALGQATQPVSGERLSLTQARRQAMIRTQLGMQATAVQTLAAKRLAANRSQTLPQLNFSGQATWQNSALAIPPLVEVPQEQFRSELELSQLLYDAGRLRTDRAVTTAQQAVDAFRIAEQWEQVIRRTDRLFFEVLLYQAQVRVRENSVATLESQQTLVRAQVREGTALAAGLDQLSATVLRQRQELIEARARLQAAQAQLAQWLDLPPGQVVALTLPDSTPVAALPVALGVRPELQTLGAQQTLLGQQQLRVLADRGPRVELFGLGGYGQPNPLNFRQVDPIGYFQGGLRVRWTLWNNNRNRLEAEALSAQQAQLAAQEADRRRTLALDLAQPLAMVQAYNALLVTDAEIIQRRQQVVASTRHRLQAGTATVNDFVTDVNDLLQAEISQELHRIQRLQAETDLRLLAGEAATLDPTAQ